MGKATGFLEYERKAVTSRAPLERIRDYSEFHPPLNMDERKRQAARCMNCGVPFCQSGENFGGGYSGCPLHNLIPEWNDEIYNGNWKVALKRLLKTNNFPEFTGRVCPALCEAACTCGMDGESVTVHDNELTIIEKGFENGWITPRIPKVRSGKKVAVIGSGPSGLAVADQLNQRGHTVTVFEKNNRPGGLLMYGIPNMKLEKSVIDRRVKLMEEEGIEFRTSVNVGIDISAAELEKEYDAVVLCVGSGKARDITVPGREGEGVYYAVDYLTASTKFVTGQTESPAITAKEKDVVVIGGGDTGNDCVGTAIRQGCRSVIQLEMMPKPPVKRTADNPWPQWPRVLKTDYGQQESIAVFGNDPRRYETTVKEIIRDENGNMTGINTVRLSRSVDKDTGRVQMTEIQGSEEFVPCQLLLIAAGFVGCEDYISESFGVETGARGTILSEDAHYATGVSKLFTAGDAHRGQSLVVWAIAEGRACAKEVDEFLMGYTNMI